MAPIKRIALILTLVFLIPALFFSVYEISSLNRDEEMIEDIYKKQLEAILFSVNQYADDILNSWITKSAYGLETMQDNNGVPPTLQNLLTLNSSIYLAFVNDEANQKNSLRIFSTDSLSSDTLSLFIKESLNNNSEQIQQLEKYKKSGFQKAEVIPTDWNGSEDLKMLVFIEGKSEMDFKEVGFIIDPEIFIQDLVGPRLQVVSKDQFTLSVYKKSTGASIYSTLMADTTSLAEAVVTRDFWIFPNYVLGIRTQGPSLQQLVRKRTTDNLLLLLGLDIILIVALILVFRNVKREVQLAQNKTDFVSNVSHEIRTPLALISMFAETLEMGRIHSEEKKKEYYTIITKETQRLSGIVNKILSFSKTEAGKRTLHIERVDLSQEIAELLKTYDFHLHNKGFSYTFIKNLDVWVMADKEALVEMIINLIDNAIKYSIEKKQIEISLGVEGDMAWVALRDYGEGISGTDQKHIFDKFYRVSSGNLAKSRGTGLGLSFVKQLVEQQKGKISVTSSLGSGSTFKLSFPLAE